MNDTLLTKFLLEETDNAETLAVRRWLEAHPDHARYYQQLKLVWDNSRQLANERRDMDEEEAWRRFVQRRDQSNTGRPRTIVQKLGWLRIAAVMVLVSCVALVSYFLLTPGYLTGNALRTTNQVNTDTLRDGSIVTLNRYASLRFSEGVLRKSRQVDLHQGSVFFQVVQRPDKPFVIRSGKVKVTVLGTSFHVNRQGDETEVRVKSGKVRVEGADKAVELTAHQQVTINTQTRKFEVDDRSQFVLDGTPLSRVAELLEVAYGVEITIEDPALRDMPLTTTLHQGDLDKALDIIAETFRITVEKDGRHIRFK